LRSPEEIHLSAVNYFSNFLLKEGQDSLPDLSHIISSVITLEENEAIGAVPLINEVKNALDSIPSNSALGPDGFRSSFFKSVWDIIKMDIMAVVEEFFRGGKWSRFCTSSYVVLIPKMDTPTGFDKFRPISLCSVFYKICSKVIVNRLATLLPKIISVEQDAFIPGRSIFENISLTQEMVHSINKKIHGGNVVLKLDMAKAYDRVEWEFLLKVLQSFGFSPVVCGLIRECITTPWYSILMNGTTKGFFKGGRGLRQGDPLSPYLFIILQEVLSRLIKEKVAEKSFRHFSQPRGTILVSHLMYADDVVVFTNGGCRSIRCILNILNTYEKWSGQLINKEKTAMYFSKKLPMARRRNLKRLMGFSEGKFPFKYLGVLIVSGRMKIGDLEELENNVKRKISGWKMKLLSAGGRVILLRHVLASMALHQLVVLQVPKLIISSLNRLMSSFFWGERDGKGKKKLVAWRNICKPIEEGGLGIRSFDEMQKALHLKLAWKLMHENSLWTNFFRSKYVGNKPLMVLDSQKGTSFWRMIVRSIPTVLSNSKWKI